MGLKQDFDHKISEALERDCSSISASEELKRRIDRTILEKQEGTIMRHLSVKKLCAGVAAACLIMSCGSVFAFRVVGVIGSSSSVPEYRSYAELDRAEEKIGYQTDHVERFSNGYAFAGACIGRNDAYGETGDTIYSTQSLEITYEKAGAEQLELNIEQKMEDIPETKQPDQTRICGDIMLRYDEYTYKFVPVGYELTEEDKINQQKENYNISVGTDQVEIQRVTHVMWKKNGISYDLFGYDLDLSAEEMLDMAEEVLNAG